MQKKCFYRIDPCSPETKKELKNQNEKGGKDPHQISGVECQQMPNCRSKNNFFFFVSDAAIE